MDLLLNIKKTMESHQNPTKAKWMQEYLRNQFFFYGLMKEDRQTHILPIIKEVKDIAINWDFVFACFHEEKREMLYSALTYLYLHRHLLQSNDIIHFEALILINSWWDSVDSIAPLVGYMVLKFQNLKTDMLKWSLHENFWVRRCAITHQLTFKKETDILLLSKIILNNLGSNEFFINKAIGWSLRAYARTNDTLWVKDFVETHKKKLAKLSVDQALKHIK